MRDGKTWHLTYWGVCKGKTKAGEPCGQSSVYGNGFCRHHGGVTSQAEIDSYRQRAIQKAERRAARLERRRRICSASWHRPGNGRHADKVSVPGWRLRSSQPPRTALQDPACRLLLQDFKAAPLQVPWRQIDRTADARRQSAHCGGSAQAMEGLARPPGKRIRRVPADYGLSSPYAPLGCASHASNGLLSIPRQFTQQRADGLTIARTREEGKRPPDRGPDAGARRCRAGRTVASERCAGRPRYSQVAGAGTTPRYLR